MSPSTSKTLSALGISSLASAAQAGAIVTDPTDIVVSSSGGLVIIDVDGNMSDDFGFITNFSPTESANADIGTADEGRGLFLDGSVLKKFTAGELIGSGTVGASLEVHQPNIPPYYADPITAPIANIVGSTLSGQWADSERAFAGFQLDSGLFGWLDLTIDFPSASAPIFSDTFTITIHAWAYEDSGASIEAGDTVGSSASVSAPGTLAILALGALPILASRRRRNNVDSD